MQLYQDGEQEFAIACGIVDDVDCSGSNLVVPYAETVIIPESRYRLPSRGSNQTSKMAVSSRYQNNILAFSDF